MSRSTFWSGIVAVPAGAVRFMFAIGRLAGSTSLFVLVLALAGALGSGQSARAADIHFIGGQDGTDNSWNNPVNWSSDPVLPGNNDDVTIDVEDPAFGVNGAIINDGETEKINSLVINASLNVLEGGQLTVVNAITNNGPGYFVNEGAVFVQNNGGTVGTVNNTYTDENTYGYIGNTGQFKTNLDNSGVAINGGDGSENSHVAWSGDVTNRATGTIISTSNATWQGDVIENVGSPNSSGSIYNQQGSTWQGDVKSNNGNIVNDSGSLWQGNVQQNGDGGLIENVDGSHWQGDVDANSNSIDNDGGIWTGNVLSNTGVIFNTASSVWNGNMTSSGDLWLSGVVNGAIVNNGGTVHVYAPLSGVTSFVNNGGALDMDDGAAGGALHAQSWSGTGTAYLDFAPALDQSDHVVLSGDYTANTDINLLTVGPSGRRLGEVPLVVVGGANTGTVTVSGLPDDGVIVYRLARSRTGWVIAAGVNDAPAHIADGLGVVGDAIEAATAVPLDQAGICGRGGWMKGLGATHAEDLAGTDSNLGFGGLELGYDFPCLVTGHAGARLGGGFVLGAIDGDIAMHSVGDDSFNANFGQGFVGAFGTLAAGPLHAILQGQVGFGSYSLADPGALVPAATLQSTRVDLGGDASYDLAYGGVTLAPELGFAASESSSSSDDLADLGKMNLSSGPTVDVHAGAKLSADVPVGGAAVLSPFASVSFHHALVAPGTATVTDGFGDSVPIAVSQVGDYVAVGLGADLLGSGGSAGTGIDAGLRANFRYGQNISDTSVSAHLDLQF